MPDKLKFWHWPDHNIGKRESRVLREEHNAAMNLNHELLEALKEAQPFVTLRTCQADKKDLTTVTGRVAAVIAKAEGLKA